MATPNITIDFDKKCSRCGRAGVVKENKAGLCMTCIAKLLEKAGKEQNDQQGRSGR